MAPVDNRSPVTGDPVPEHYLHAASAHFRATDGRTVLLRGINLASSAKTPRGQPGAQLNGFWEGAKSGELSWVGRILELDQADLHLKRLKSWGFTCLRLVTTWEAIEHAGPGKYDQDYLDYVVALVRKCKEYSFRVYIDPHQDLWSRFSGGSGAPYWTILACGFEPQNFTKTRAAVIECEWPDAAAPDPAAFPKMIWATNYARLAVQTIFTLFFAGREYAPKCIIDGVNIQDYLQTHFFNAYRKLGEALADAGDLLDETVIGWDSLNEPNAGYVGVEDLGHHGKESVLRVGPMPTGLQAMRMGMGERMEVENWKSGPLGPKRDGSVVVDPQGTIAWLAPEAEQGGRSPWGWQRDPGWKLGTCIWAQHGVWDVDSGELLRPDYFSQVQGRLAEFGADFWLPFFQEWAPIIREVHPDAILFAHSPVFQIPPKITSPDLKNRVAFSSHFYDGLTLITKHWNWFNADAIGILRGKYASVVLGVKVGEAAIRRCMRSQLGVLRQDGFDAIGQVPFMMGEIGIPYDLDDKRSYKTGNYAQQVRALDASLSACDGKNMMNYTTWCYCPDNCHEWGDLWNGEDLSVWSPDDILRPAGSVPSTADSSRSASPSDQKGKSLLGNDDDDDDDKTPPPEPEHPINLNDGARALPAFVRPYPLKSVGTPVNIEFDIRTSKFKLEIEVEADDVADASLPTEIYVPLSHYAAHPQHVSYDIREADRRHGLTGFLKNPPAGDVGEGSVIVEEEDNGVDAPSDPARELALAVKVSSGRYEIDAEGQMLRWYYPRPTSGSMTVTIELERVGGAIPLWVNQWYRGGFDRVEQKNWSGNFCSLVGVTLVGVLAVTVTAASLFREV